LALLLSHIYGYCPLFNHPLTGMRNLIGPFVILLIIACTACSSRAFLSLSQSDFEELKSDLQKLEKSTLVVRLYTNNPKIKALRKTGDQKALNKYIKDRQKYMRLMMEVWSINYDFSEIVYIPDSLFKTFEQNPEGSYFLNSSLDLDPSIQLNTKDYFILGRGERDLAFVWMDQDQRKLDPQPPVNFDKLTPWEMIQGTEKFLNYRVRDANAYFHKVVNANADEK
jgi:hypothetical protein